jgi:NIMA (never in mitosis gene a)-related kinase
MSESCLRDFRDLKLIGKGSFGRVYRCIRNSDGQEYAMKEVAIKAMSQREREDAVNEVRILASVNHNMVIKYVLSPIHPPPMTCRY